MWVVSCELWVSATGCGFRSVALRVLGGLQVTGGRLQRESLITKVIDLKVFVGLSRGLAAAVTLLWFWLNAPLSRLKYGWFVADVQLRDCLSYILPFLWPHSYEVQALIPASWEYPGMWPKWWTGYEVEKPGILMTYNVQLCCDFRKLPFCHTATPGYVAQINPVITAKADKIHLSRS